MKRHSTFLAVVLFMLFAGCGTLRDYQRQGIAGTWAGKSVIGYKGAAQEWKATLVLKENLTFTLTYEKNGSGKN